MHETEGQTAETLEATLEHVIYSSETSAYVVGRFAAEGELFFVVATGEMLNPAIGETYHLTGAWVQHPKYGRQFRWDRYEIQHPVTPEGIERYLASGLIRGIGKVNARRIVKHFGAKTIDILNDNIERLLEVEGIGEKTLERIRASWEEQKDMQEVLVFLQAHNVGAGYAVRIFRAYGPDAIQRIQNDPYRLVEDVDGIGFVTADTVARSLGIDERHQGRLSAGVLYALREAARSTGHTCVPEEACVGMASRLMAVDSDEVRPALRRLIDEDRVLCLEDRVALPEYHYAEQSIAESLHRLLGAELAHVDPSAIADVARRCENKLQLEFTPLQAEAIQKALAGPVAIVTGGPGTGKTTAIAGLLAASQAMSLETALCAPTGRAAKRLSEVTGHEAKTIHRLLEFDPRDGFFRRSADRPLDCDLVVVDEVSMVDVQLMAHLLMALRNGVRLVLVGDADQLPSIGPGNVLRDLLAIEYIETVRLHLIFRQEESSSIITNAHRVNRGFEPVFEGETMHVETGPDSLPDVVTALVVDRLPREFDLDPMRDIQVLTPMHGTPAGTKNLNAVLQRALNSSGRTVWQKGERSFRLGDKVMQTRNDYDKEVFNGDIGILSGFDDDEGIASIIFDNREIRYDIDELEDLTLAYATTIHKSQGSEYEAVVIPVTFDHRIMLQRNLLYTAVTRAKRLLFFAGQRQALGYAVRNDRLRPRYTALQHHLHHMFR